MFEIIDKEIFLKIVEYIGLITGILYVIGAVLEKKWCWYFGILAVISYGISTYFYKLYGEFILQFFYLALSIYGLFQWSKHTDEDDLSLKEYDTTLKIEFSSFKFLMYNIIVGVLLSFILYIGLVYFKSTFPFWDAITSGFGIIATYMTVKKKIDNWIIWIVIDIILSIILYLKGMPFYSILYIVYVGFATLGFYNWNKEMNKQ